METIEKREGDRINYAVEADSRYAWVNNKKTKLSAPTFEWKKLKYHGLGGDALVRAIYTMVRLLILWKHLEDLLSVKQEKFMQI